jgi:hypothetical protein
MGKLRSSSSEKGDAVAAFDDEVYPTTLVDNTQGPRDIVLAWILHFNDVLDADKLHDALARLIETGDWRKLGGRLRQGKGKGKNKRLELHVPRQFTKERPGVVYTHNVHDMKLRDHPAGRRIPSASTSPCVFPSVSDDNHTFSTRPGAPTTTEDFLRQDIPQLSLYITSFTDATIVALSWHHAVIDAMAQRELLSAWSKSLAGHPIPPVLGARGDVLNDAVQSMDGNNREEYALDHQRLQGGKLVVAMLYYLWDKFQFRKNTSGMIFLPQKAVTELLVRARKDLEQSAIIASTVATEKDVPTPKDTPPFISEGDVLVAWLTSMVSTSRGSRRPLNILTPVDARTRLPGLIDARGIYLQNMLAISQVLVPFDLGKGPLGHIALAHRHALQQQTTTGQLIAFFRTLSEFEKKGGGMLVCQPPSATTICITNWTKGDFVHTADFGPAVIRQGERDETRTNPLGTLLYHHATSLANKRGMGLGIAGKDHQGNYWIGGALPPRTWRAIEHCFKGNWS